MGETPLSERQVRLLSVVAEGGGEWDARRIDLTVSARHGPGPGTVLRELEELRQLGLVVRDDSRSGAGGRWKATAAARLYLDDRDDAPDQQGGSRHGTALPGSHAAAPSPGEAR